MTTLTLLPVDIEMDDFAERLRSLRVQRGLTQTRLAELLDMPARSYNRWERGGHVPHLEMAVKIAEILQVSLDELVGRSEATSEPAIKNTELHQLVQEVDQLPDREQQAVIVMLDGLLRSAQVTRAVNRRGTARRSASR
ncbi:MAG: helix-turn-helix transcriptional regulator [Gammaproteobacteria bacterium]|nr:MAG: helix-turn-helix transcriptional regulator [Gammaproteobacteria bacterium]